MKKRKEGEIKNRIIKKTWAPKENKRQREREKRKRISKLREREREREQKNTDTHCLPDQTHFGQSYKTQPFSLSSDVTCLKPSRSSRQTPKQDTASKNIVTPRRKHQP